MMLTGRHSSSTDYRYGYQGSEKDDEVKGSGNSYTTAFRQLDPRIGRWLSYDPKPEAGVSPYSSMDNNPIKHNDILGLYTKEGAERRAKRGNRKGYTTSVSQNPGGGEKNWSVTYSKRNESDNGTYRTTKTEGKFRGIGEQGLTLDSEYSQKQAGAAEKIIESYVYMEIVKRGVEKSVETAGSGILKALGLTVSFVLTPHSGHYPTNEMDQYRNPNLNPNFELNSKKANDDYITLYRGVGENSHSTMYTLAQGGLAVPRAFIPDIVPGSPHSNPNDHTTGNNYSFSTSWSKELSVAQGAALRNSNAGVVLTIVVKKSEMIISNASRVFPFDEEQEVQLQGVRQALFVTPITKP